MRQDEAPVRRHHRVNTPEWRVCPLSDRNNSQDEVAWTDESGRRYVHDQDRHDEPLIDPGDEVSRVAGVPYAAGGVGYVPAGDTALTDDADSAAGIPDEAGTPTHFQEAAELGQHTLQEFKADYERRAEASPGGSGNPTGLMEQIREGMRVIDADGKEVGKVDYVQMGDPQAITTEGQELDAPDTFLDDLAGAFGARDEPRIPEPMRHEALRIGYIKIDAKGFFAADRYALATMIGAVENDAVILTVPESALAKED